MGIGLEALAYRNQCSWEIRLFYNYDTLRLYLQACGKRQKHMGARHKNSSAVSLRYRNVALHNESIPKPKPFFHHIKRGQ